MLAWSDGDSIPPRRASFLRCALCGCFNARSSFEDLGRINHGCREFFLRLDRLGPEPFRVMKRLRYEFGWKLGDIKAHLASFPLDLPKMRSLGHALTLRSGLAADGAHSEILETVVEEPDPVERLDAPWAISPQSPLELEGLVHLGMPEECAARLDVYRLSNAPYRDPKVEWVGPMQRTSFESENARVLSALLDSGDEIQWLLRANIARECGKFALADELLRQREPEEYSVWYSCLRALVSERIERVTMVWPPDRHQAHG